MLLIGPIWLAVACALIMVPALFFTRTRHRLRLFWALLCVSLLITLAGLGFWTWFFRDGLAPGFVPTEGRAALALFVVDFWPTLIVHLVILALGFLGYRRGLRRLSLQSA